MKRISRRAFEGLVLAAGTAPVAKAAPRRRLKILAVSGHPDDAESGCGGTLARYVAAGHAVTIAYLTRGEAGIAGKSAHDAAAIRTAEAHAACKQLGTRPVFLGQVDGATELTSARVGQVERVLRAEAPDVVLTHWPVDTHMDHAVAGQLTALALAASALPARLYYYEVMTGAQTQAFSPTDYVDIAPSLDNKRAALFLHKSQDIRAVYRDHHDPMERFRGREAGVRVAEAFVAGGRFRGGLPGLDA